MSVLKVNRTLSNFYKVLSITLSLAGFYDWTSCVFGPCDGIFCDIPLACVPLTNVGGWAIGKVEFEECAKEIRSRPDKEQVAQCIKEFFK